MKVTEAQLRKGIRKMIHEQFNNEISVEEDIFRAGEDDAFDGNPPRMPDDPDYMMGYQQATDELDDQKRRAADEYESFRRQELQRYPNRGYGGGSYAGD